MAQPGLCEHSPSPAVPEVPAGPPHCRFQSMALPRWAAGTLYSSLRYPPTTETHTHIHNMCVLSTQTPRPPCRLYHEKFPDLGPTPAGWPPPPCRPHVMGGWGGSKYHIPSLASPCACQLGGLSRQTEATLLRACCLLQAQGHLLWAPTASPEEGCGSHVGPPYWFFRC